MNRREFALSAIAAPAIDRLVPCGLTSQGRVVSIGSADWDSEDELRQLNATEMKDGHRWCCTSCGDATAGEIDTRFGLDPGTTQMRMDSGKLMRFNGNVFYLRRLSSREMAMYNQSAKQES